MQENIKVNDLNILFICPSEQWGTLERRVINDCHYLRDIGGNPVLYCTKGSPIDKEAQKFSLPRQFYKGKKVNRFFDFTYLLDIKSILKENSFDIIHCFNIDYLWAVCFLLKAKPHIPLMVTFNRYMKNKTDDVIKRWLLKRVDLMMTFSGAIRSVVLNHLPIDGKKVHVVGAGIEVLEHQKEFKDKKKFVIGTLVSHKEELDNLRTFLYAINPIINKLAQVGMKARFMVFTDQVNEDVFDARQFEKTVEVLRLTKWLPLFNSKISPYVTSENCVNLT